MDGETPIYEFGEFRLDVGEKQLRLSNGEVLTIPPKAFALLLFLVENPHHLLEKNELMDKVWADSFVEEGNLKIHIHTLRKILNEDGVEYIETIPRRGYRFNADVKAVGGELVVDKITRSKLVIKQSETEDGNSLVLSSARVSTRTIAAVLGVVALLMIGSLVYFGFVLPRAGSTAVSPPVRPTAIAVLAFKNLTQDDKDEFLGAGLSDALIMKLSGMKHLVVRPTSAVLPYASSQETPQKIGEALKVEALIDGTIQRLGDRLRVSLQLVSVADSRVLWAGTFEETDHDLFKFQDAFSEDIANALQFSVSREELAALKRLDTTNPEAYRLYLNARYFFSQLTADGLRRSIDLYKQAVKLDDRYALAYAGIGEAYMVLGESSLAAIKPAEAYQNAIAATQKALELDSNLPEAFAVLGNAQAKHVWDIPAAETSYRRAIEINPNYSRGHHLLGWCLIRQSRFEEADGEFRRAVELNPTSLESSSESGYPAFFAGDYDRAIVIFRDAVERDRNFGGMRMNIWRALHHAGRYDEAMAEIRTAEKLYGPGVPVVEMAIGRTLALQGKTTEAGEIMKRLVTRKDKGEYISPLFLAILAADLNDGDAVFRWLDECIAERNDYMPYMTFAPEFTKFHNDPRFSELLTKIKPLS